MGPGNKELFNLSHHCVKFYPYRSCRSENITFLFCQLASRDHMIKGTCDFVSRNESTYVITAKFDACRCRGSRDTAILFCCLVSRDHRMKWSCDLESGSHCAKFNAYRSYEKVDITFLFCFILSRDHIIK